MKKLMLSVAQFALLRKVEERVGFSCEKIDDFLHEHNGKEEFPVLELDKFEVDDIVESLNYLETDDEEEATIVQSLLKELTTEEPFAETEKLEEEKQE